MKNSPTNDASYDFKIFTISDYVACLNSPILIDKLSNTANNNGEKDFLYEPHLPLSNVLTQLKAGTLYKGNFRSNLYSFLEATVTIVQNNEEINVTIQGRQNINRAINGDVVAIQILPKSEWKSINTAVLDEDEEENELSKNGNDESSGELSQKPFGKVVSIIKKNWREYCGVVLDKSSSSNYFLFAPVDKRIPFIRIETRQYENIKGKKILVTVDNWPFNSKYPRGHYTRIIGESGDKQTETSVLLLEHRIPHMEFSTQVLNCLPFEGENWKPKPDDLIDRLDLRNEFIVSVDPPGCTDIDDALHCKDLGNNIYEIGVHIADVSHFIKPGTAIDKEAAERGTTVYLADRRIDMIPPLLSSNLCSLMQNVERLSFSCIWNINSKTGTILNTKFTKSIIKSKASLTYGEAQTMIDNQNDNSEIAQSLRRLNSLSKILKANRINKGSLILASANEIKFLEVESETAENDLVIVEKKLLETNSLIEEFMLLANVSVAQKIFEFFPELSVLRRHPKPAASNFEELIIAARNRGFQIDTSCGKSLSNSLNKAIDPNNEQLNLLLRMITTRCLSQAVYFCSGSLNNDITFFHFGLAAEIYTHFTSPIRRYADLLVHRLLSHAINFEIQEPEFLNKRKISDVCEHINMRNMNARRASRASNELHSYLYVRNSNKEFVKENGHIFIIKKNALIIFIMHLSFEVIYMLNPIDSWLVDEENGYVIHKPTSTKLRQFDPIQIEMTIKKGATSNFKKQIVVKLINPKLD